MKKKKGGGVIKAGAPGTLLVSRAGPGVALSQAGCCPETPLKSCLWMRLHMKYVVKKREGLEQKDTWLLD